MVGTTDKLINRAYKYGDGLRYKKSVDDKSAGDRLDFTALMHKWMAHNATPDNEAFLKSINLDDIISLPSFDLIMDGKATPDKHFLYYLNYHIPSEVASSGRLKSAGVTYMTKILDAGGLMVEADKEIRLKLLERGIDRIFSREYAAQEKEKGVDQGEFMNIFFDLISKKVPEDKIANIDLDNVISYLTSRIDMQVEDFKKGKSFSLEYASAAAAAVAGRMNLAPDEYDIMHSAATSFWSKEEKGQNDSGQHRFCQALKFVRKLKNKNTDEVPTVPFPTVSIIESGFFMTGPRLLGEYFKGLKLSQDEFELITNKFRNELPNYEKFVRRTNFKEDIIILRAMNRPSFSEGLKLIEDESEMGALGNGLKFVRLYKGLDKKDFEGVVSHVSLLEAETGSKIAKTSYAGIFVRTELPENDMDAFAEFLKKNLPQKTSGRSVTREDIDTLRSMQHPKILKYRIETAVAGKETVNDKVGAAIRAIRRYKGVSTYYMINEQNINLSFIERGLTTISPKLLAKFFAVTELSSGEMGMAVNCLLKIVPDVHMGIKTNSKEDIIIAKALTQKTLKGAMTVITRHSENNLIATTVNYLRLYKGKTLEDIDVGNDAINKVEHGASVRAESLCKIFKSFDLLPVEAEHVFSELYENLPDGLTGEKGNNKNDIIALRALYKNDQKEILGPLGKDIKAPEIFRIEIEKAISKKENPNDKVVAAMNVIRRYKNKSASYYFKKHDLHIEMKERGNRPVSATGLSKFFKASELTDSEIGVAADCLIHVLPPIKAGIKTNCREDVIVAKAYANKDFFSAIDSITLDSGKNSISSVVHYLRLATGKKITDFPDVSQQTIIEVESGKSMKTDTLYRIFRNFNLLPTQSEHLFNKLTESLPELVKGLKENNKNDIVITHALYKNDFKEGLDVIKQHSQNTIGNVLKYIRLYKGEVLSESNRVYEAKVEKGESRPTLFYVNNNFKKMGLSENEHEIIIRELGDVMDSLKPTGRILHGSSSQMGEEASLAVA